MALIETGGNDRDRGWCRENAGVGIMTRQRKRPWRVVSEPKDFASHSLKSAEFQRVADLHPKLGAELAGRASRQHARGDRRLMKEPCHAIPPPTTLGRKRMMQRRAEITPTARSGCRSESPRDAIPGDHGGRKRPRPASQTNVHQFVERSTAWNRGKVARSPMAGGSVSDGKQPGYLRECGSGSRESEPQFVIGPVVKRWIKRADPLECVPADEDGRRAQPQSRPPVPTCLGASIELRDRLSGRVGEHGIAEEAIRGRISPGSFQDDLQRIVEVKFTSR